MKKITIRLDEPVHTFFVHLAAEQRISLSRLINETLARLVVAEQSFDLMEARAAQAHPGAMQQVLDRTAAHGLAPCTRRMLSRLRWIAVSWQDVCVRHAAGTRRGKERSTLAHGMRPSR